MLSQGQHGWQDPQGLGLAWILENRRQRRQQRQHAADVATIRACLPKLAVAALLHSSSYEFENKAY